VRALQVARLDGDDGGLETARDIRGVFDLTQPLGRLGAKLATSFDLPLHEKQLAQYPD
jgi:hypothetical protein